MVFDLSQVAHLGPHTEQPEKGRTLYLRGDRAFLVLHPNTIELRCDAKLAALLQEKYESVMQSRYFGRGGIEVVLSGQLTQQELVDLVHHSYSLTQPTNPLPNPSK